jgi:hypothetical protein
MEDVSQLSVRCRRTRLRSHRVDLDARLPVAVERWLSCLNGCWFTFHSFLISREQSDRPRDDRWASSVPSLRCRQRRVSSGGRSRLSLYTWPNTFDSYTASARQSMSSRRNPSMRYTVMGLEKKIQWLQLHSADACVFFSGHLRYRMTPASRLLLNSHEAAETVRISATQFLFRPVKLLRIKMLMWKFSYGET